MTEGKLPPQAVELECAVLGALMLERDAIHQIADILTAECFYNNQNRFIYEAVSQLHNNNKPIDILTVTNILRQSGNIEKAGGHNYVVSLTNKIGSSANIEEHARIIYEKYLQRRIIEKANYILKTAYDDTTDAFELLANTQSEFDSIGNSITSGETFYDTVINRAHDLEQAQSNQTKSGLTTWLYKFDNHTGGFQPGELIIVAARPAMGKSALMLDFAYNQAKHDNAVGIFSLEMNKAQLTDRFISMACNVEYEKMRTGYLSKEDIVKIQQAAMQVAELQILMDDNGGIGIGKITSIAKMWKHRYNIKALYVDYIQLVGADDAGKKFGNREQELSHVSRKLKQLAKSLHIPVIALAQLSRAVESRSDKRPMLSDLRESGAIEQDADMIIFPFRPSYYQLKDSTGADFREDYCELMIAKFRNGKPKDLEVTFYPQYSKFSRDVVDAGNFRRINNDETPF